MNISLLNNYSIYLSSKINHVIATQFPKHCPFILVYEFPRSGGNWIRDMLGDCLQLPVPRFSNLPVSFKSLVHSHFPEPIHHIPAVYVVRDGRDVLTSHFWKSISGIMKGDVGITQSILKRHPSLKHLVNTTNQEKVDHINHSTILKDYYIEWKNRPMGCPVNWGKHVDSTCKLNIDSLAVIRYEDMHADPHKSLKKAITCLTGGSCPDATVNFSIIRNSFKEKTGRSNGSEDGYSTRRKGIVGDWKNYFSKELEKNFLDDFGNQLSLLNYL